MMGQMFYLDRFVRESQTHSTTTRYREAVMAEAYNLSLQYTGKNDWHDKSVPLRKRKPRMIIPLPRKIIEQVDRLIWSGSRAPRIIVEATVTPESDNEIGPLLDADEAESLQSFIVRMVHQGKLLKVASEFSNKALVTTSALVVVGYKAGYLNCYVHGGKDCLPVFSKDNPRELESVEIKYQFKKDIEIGFGLKHEKWFWYRRVIDKMMDTVYQEVEVYPGQPPEWVVDKEKTVKHDLGFCPAVWVRTFPDCNDPIDGRPLIDPALYPLFDAINYTMSQKQRAVEYGCDPQPWRKGVPDSQKKDLEKSPGKIWDLPGDNDKDGKVAVGFLEATGSGVVRASEHTKELYQSLREIVGVVDSNPEMHARAVSGAALEMLYAPMVSLADDLRSDLGDEAFCDLLNIAIRTAVSVYERGEDVWIPGISKISALLKKAQLRGIWLPLPIRLQWPKVLPESEDDKAKRVLSTVQAEQAHIISRASAVRHLGGSFDLTDIASEIEAIEEEIAEQPDYGPMLDKNKSDDETGDE